jgi:hypothetical protein
VPDHIGVPMSDFDRSMRFCAEALSRWATSCSWNPASFQLDSDGRASLTSGSARASQAFHIAFAARAAVDSFLEAAIAAGGHNNGAPGLRPSTIQAPMRSSFSILTATILKRSAMSQEKKPPQELNQYVLGQRVDIEDGYGGWPLPPFARAFPLSAFRPASLHRALGVFRG